MILLNKTIEHLTTFPETCTDKSFFVGSITPISSTNSLKTRLILKNSNAGKNKKWQAGRSRDGKAKGPEGQNRRGKREKCRHTGQENEPGWDENMKFYHPNEPGCDGKDQGAISEIGSDHFWKTHGTISEGEPEYSFKSHGSASVFQAAFARRTPGTISESALDQPGKDRGTISHIGLHPEAEKNSSARIYYQGPGSPYHQQNDRVWKMEPDRNRKGHGTISESVLDYCWRNDGTISEITVPFFRRSPGAIPETDPHCEDGKDSNTQISYQKPDAPHHQQNYHGGKMDPNRGRQMGNGGKTEPVSEKETGCTYENDSICYRQSPVAVCGMDRDHPRRTPGTISEMGSDSCSKSHEASPEIHQSYPRKSPETISALESENWLEIDPDCTGKSEPPHEDLPRRNQQEKMQGNDTMRKSGHTGQNMDSTDSDKEKSKARINRHSPPLSEPHYGLPGERAYGTEAGQNEEVTIGSGIYMVPQQGGGR